MKRKTIYTVIRIDKWVEFKTVVASVHTYSFETSNKERVIDYAKKIKRTYPDKKVAVVSREKAAELSRIFYNHRKEKEKMALAELDKKSNDILLRQTVYSTFSK